MALKIRKQEQPVLSRMSVLVYGQPKIGKTRFASGMPQPLFLACEPGGCDFVSGDVIDIASLSELVQVAGELAQGASAQYKTVVIDGVTWVANQAAVLAAKGQKDGRRGYQQVTEQLSQALSGLLSAGLGVVATGHSRSLVVDESTGKIETRPDVNEALADDLAGLFSFVFYAHLSKEGNAVALTKPIDTDRRRVVAGDRSGVLPKLMQLEPQAMLTALGAAGQQPGSDSKRQQRTNGSQQPPAPAEALPAGAARMTDAEAAALWRKEGEPYPGFAG